MTPGGVVGLRKIRSYWVVYVGWPNAQHYQFRTKREAVAFMSSQP